MNAKLTAENNPVWVSPKISTEWTRSNQIAHEGERRAEIFVVLLRIVSVKRVGFLMIDGGGGGVDMGLSDFNGSKNSSRAE